MQDEPTPELAAWRDAEARRAGAEQDLAAWTEREREATAALGAAIADGRAPTSERRALAEARARVEELAAASPILRDQAEAARLRHERADRVLRRARLAELTEERALAAETADQLLGELAAVLDRHRELAHATRPVAVAHGLLDPSRYGDTDYTRHWLGARLARFWPGLFAPAPPAFDGPLARAERVHLEGAR